MYTIISTSPVKAAAGYQKQERKTAVSRHIDPR